MGVGCPRAFGNLRSMTTEPGRDDQLETRRSDPRYQRLMAATREAARGGYEAVSMRELAETTRMSLTTVYQFCSSKDHLIAEAHLEGMDAFRRSVMTGRRSGGSLEQRVLRVVRGIISGLEQDEVLTRTLMRAIYSVDAGVSDVNRSIAGAYHDMLEHAIGDDDIPDRDAVIETLGRVVDSTVYGWMARGESVDHVRTTLEQAVHLLVGAVDPSASGRPARRRPAGAKTRRDPARAAKSG
jgi:AcrR family transcriptional regulator